MSNNLARGQEKLIVPISPYTSAQSCDDLQYQTGQNINGQRRAADVIPHGVFLLSTLNAIEAGSTTRKIIKTAHGARKNDILHFTSGLNIGVAIQILSCPDANTMILAGTPEFSSTVGDTFDLKRHVTPLYDSTGALAVGAPVGGATAANQVLEIAQLTAINSNTDGIETLVGTSNTSLASIDAKTPALSAGAVPVAGPLTDTQLRATPVPVSGTVSTGGLTDTQLRATPVPVSGTVTANAGTNLNTSALALETTQALIKAKTDNLDIALSTTALKNQFPATLGQTTKANSISAAVPSDQATQTAPFGIRESDGTNWLGSIALAAAQLTTGVITAIKAVMAINMGWDGTTHREMAVDTNGSQKMVPATTSGTITQIQATIGTSAARATVAGTAPNAARKRLSFKPAAANTGVIYFGASTVTISTGMQIIGPDRLDFLMDASDYYLISDTAGQKVEIVEVI